LYNYYIGYSCTEKSLHRQTSRQTAGQNTYSGLDLEKNLALRVAANEKITKNGGGKIFLFAFYDI